MKYSHHVSQSEKKKEKSSGRTIIGKGMSLKKGEAQKLRKKPGMGSVGKYKTISKKKFAGPDGTFPIQDIAHARNALARAHFAKDPSAIRKKVHAMYPSIDKKKTKKG